MIEFRDITEDNFRAVVRMTLPESQCKYVASNVYSLAQAWVEQPEARPYAIYADEELIGFIMFDWDKEENSLGLWRFMIATEHQGKGYGQAALVRMLELAREEGFESVNLDYVPGNDCAEHIYTKLGFKPTGEVEDGEIVMLLKL